MSETAVEFGLLKGVLHGAGSSAGFVCIHGLTLKHDMFEELGRRADAAGLSVLRFHLRGHFDSGAKLEEQGFNDAVDDVLAGVEFLKSQAGMDPERVGLLGFSIGGAEASVASKKISIKALAIWGSLLDTRRWREERYAQYRKPKGGIIKIWDDIAVSDRLFSEAIACDPFQDALEYGGPFFAAHGGRDHNHPQEKSIELVEKRRALGLPAEGFFPADSGHKFMATQDRELLNQKTLDFFKAAL